MPHSVVQKHWHIYTLSVILVAGRIISSPASQSPFGRKQGEIYRFGAFPEDDDEPSLEAGGRNKTFYRSIMSTTGILRDFQVWPPLYDAWAVRDRSGQITVSWFLGYGWRTRSTKTEFDARDCELTCVQNPSSNAPVESKATITQSDGFEDGSISNEGTFHVVTCDLQTQGPSVSEVHVALKFTHNLQRYPAVKIQIDSANDAPYHTLAAWGYFNSDIMRDCKALELWASYYISMGVEFFYLYDARIGKTMTGEIIPEEHVSLRECAGPLTTIGRAQVIDMSIDNFEKKFYPRNWIDPSHISHKLLLQIPTMNHCFFRHRHSFRWLIIADKDDFFVPLGRHSTLRSVLGTYDVDAVAGVCSRVWQMGSLSRRRVQLRSLDDVGQYTHSFKDIPAGWCFKTIASASASSLGIHRAQPENRTKKSE